MVAKSARKAVKKYSETLPDNLPGKLSEAQILMLQLSEEDIKT